MRLLGLDKDCFSSWWAKLPAGSTMVVQPKIAPVVRAAPVVSGRYINYNPAGTNHANVVVQSQPVVVPSAPVRAHINNGYNRFTGNTAGQNVYGIYGSKCALSKLS